MSSGIKEAQSMILEASQNAFENSLAKIKLSDVIARLEIS